MWDTEKNKSLPGDSTRRSLSALEELVLSGDGVEEELESIVSLCSLFSEC